MAKAKAEPILPFKKKSSNDSQTSSAPKLTPRKIFLVIFLILLSLSLLNRPTICYGKPKEGHGLKTVEERARHILSKTPLIGNTRPSHSHRSEADAK